MRENLVELAIKLPFEPARKQEAIKATSASFRRIARLRITQPEFQDAARQFNREILKSNDHYR
jgi:hypothetical protein